MIENQLNHRSILTISQNSISNGHIVGDVSLTCGYCGFWKKAELAVLSSPQLSRSASSNSMVNVKSRFPS